MFKLITYDPCGEYSYMDTDAVLAACGFIPSWCQNYEIGSEKLLIKYLEEMYGFGPLYPMQGILNNKGVYAYPGDPPLKPYLRIMWFDSNPENPDAVLFQYPHAIVAVIQGDHRFITRMD